MSLSSREKTLIRLSDLPPLFAPLSILGSLYCQDTGVAMDDIPGEQNVRGRALYTCSYKQQYIYTHRRV